MICPSVSNERNPVFLKFLNHLDHLSIPFTRSIVAGTEFGLVHPFNEFVWLETQAFDCPEAAGKMELRSAVILGSSC
jgi:hypothetical protein